MNIIVCVKAVPDMESHFKIRPDALHIEDEDLIYKMNSFDEYAIEAALQLKEKFGGEIVIVSLGEESSKQIMRKAFAMGADRGILLIDPAFKDSDTLTVAKLIQKGTNDFSYDIILTGVQAEDNANAQVGPILAQFLNIPHTTVVTKIDMHEDGKRTTLHRELEGGFVEVLEMSLPCLLTIQSGINIPRYPSLPGIMKAKKKETKEYNLATLGINPTQVGIQSSKVKRISLHQPIATGNAQMISGDPHHIATILLAKLKERKVFN